MTTATSVLIGLLAALAMATQAQEIVFASAEQARAVLTTKDAFVERLSPFDRAARLKTDQPVAEQEYLDFVAAAALEWTAAEKTSMAAAYRALAPKLAALHLPLPAEILAIETTGQEEGHTPYTRQNAVIVPGSKLQSANFDGRRLLAHELFHIASRTNPGLAERLYAVIGFHPCGVARYPASLAARKLTNPDAPRNDYCIHVTLDGQPVNATPILFSKAAAYDRSRGGEFFEYLELGLLIRDAAAERVVGLHEVAGFFEQIGQNTEYVIHPEEILADNFALLALDARNVKTPAVLDALRAALADFDAAASTLSEGALLAYATAPYDKGALLKHRPALGKLNGVRVIVDYVCADVCPAYTVRIIRLDVDPGPRCAPSGGVAKPVVVPFGIAARSQTFCFPRILAEHWDAYVR
jgi:hypothetical protein